MNARTTDREDAAQRGDRMRLGSRLMKPERESTVGKPGCTMACAGAGVITRKTRGSNRPVAAVFRSGRNPPGRPRRNRPGGAGFSAVGMD